MNQEALHTNRLIHERSPYLLQHAHNPVDWYPWAEEALARARDEEKPIFLSIGYSTCHWCHVMERESFENEEIARLLNEQFVPIKVDREERPDLDKLYMAAVHAQTGRGGWPLSVFLTPDLQPFFGGTYFPPEDRWGRPGFETLLTRIAEAWRTDREDLVENSVRITEFLRKQSGDPGAVAGEMSLGKGILTQAFEQLKRSYDGRHAGFGQAPKFPTPHNLTFLLRYAHRTGTQEALQMVRSTLDAMAAGGIHDHLGGGFHRYSTDAEWLVPHFEKMLYDQAGLATAYTDAWLVTRDLTYAAVARDILEYVLNYLRDPAGGFFSAEDADSEGEEGTFYVWTAEEILALLGEKPGQAFNQEFGVRPGGNWEGRSILNRASPRPALGRAMDRSRAGLLEARNRRPRPRRDEKIIAAWNGYMIEAFARAGRALPEPRYIKAAEDAARFIEENLWRDGRLMRYERAGVADALGCLDDYAFLGRGLLALYEATFRPRYLARAVGLAREMVRLFHRSRGGFAFTGSDAESLLAPVVEIGDGAMPSSNSAASLFLLRLGHLTADTEMEQQGRRVLQAFQRAVSRSPGSHLEMLSALDFALGPVTEVLIAAPSPDASSDPAVAAMIGKLWDRYLPNTVSALRPEDGAEAITSLIPYAKQQGMIDGIVTAYVCRDYACTLPVHDARALAEELETD